MQNIFRVIPVILLREFGLWYRVENY